MLIQEHAALGEIMFTLFSRDSMRMSRKVTVSHDTVRY